MESPAIRKQIDRSRPGFDNRDHAPRADGTCTCDRLRRNIHGPEHLIEVTRNTFGGYVGQGIRG